MALITLEALKQLTLAKMKIEIQNEMAQGHRITMQGRVREVDFVGVWRAHLEVHW